MVQKSWQLAVYQACLAEIDETNFIFTRKILIKNQLDEIKRATNSKGKTPEQSMSRILQEFRNFGFIKFLSNGQYKLTKKDIDVALLQSKKMSRGEKLVAQILDDFNIPYIQESTHSDLKYKGYLRFDFEINHMERKFVIEVDGVQHDRPIDYFGGVEAFVIRKKCDQIKDEYCKKTDITMVRIKSTQLKYDVVEKIIIDLLFEPTDS